TGSGLTTSVIYGIFDVNGTAFFRAFEPNTGAEVWKSDGTDAGTVLVADVNPGPNTSDPAFFESLNGAVDVSATKGSSGLEPWKVASGGARSLGDRYPGASSPAPIYWVFADGFVYFYAADPTHGHELWRTDGTPGGTALFQDVNPGPPNSTDSTLC